MKINSEERKIEVKQYRMGLFLGATAYPFFGWFSEKYVTNDFDSLLIRLPVALLSAFLFSLTYTRFGKKYIRVFIILVASVAFNHYAIMFCKSNYHFYYSIGITALPFIIFTFLFHPIDVILFFIFSLGSLFYHLKELNFIFLSVYLILVMMAFLIYVFVIKSRLDLLKTLRLNLDEIDSKNKSLVSIGELAAQVAHDIRSPVAALQAVSETLDDIEPKKKQLIEKSALRIGQIADYLVSEYRTNVTSDIATKAELRAQYLNDVINDILEEKRVILKKNGHIKFENAEIVSVPTYLNLVEFKRALSNILNNSIEAFNKSENRILVKLQTSTNLIEVYITDNGRGISSQYIQQVFEKGVKFSKKQGTGLGLSHAKQFLDSIGGKISITSKEDEGTTVIIQLMPS